MVREVRKTYYGMIELKDYHVEKCIKNNETMEVHLKHQVMFLTPFQLKEERLSVSAPQVSKHGTKPYRLYGYLWQPINLQTPK